ncbi:hypothetical protein [Chitinophaga nivalis]|uniref:Uncharacterized protein n=1 Tax=Chitinophaga nivalis TaxID=2991709 RepID=A0ABT3IR18_9BACT|nr:hypothetical protein [Chitinophaga nivalis]MCW3463887.1 hypothetical protein [Chitinophaga nivalis]MCW3486423.1 hypothetical protein [Chitinophaga nivalis]
MKNQVPPVTSLYFITLMKAYLRGTKTSKEVVQDLTETVGLLHFTEDREEEMTRLLLRAATEFNKDYYQEIVTHITYAADTTPTRAGVIHQLQALLQGDITARQLQQWGTWHNEQDTDEGAGYFDDIAVDYFCTHLLPEAPAHFGTEQYQQALKIFQSGPQQLKDKVALVLLTEKEKKRFLFYLGDYLQGYTTSEQLNTYLLHTFGMDHQAFPYTPALSIIMQDPAKLPALLKEAAYE